MLFVSVAAVMLCSQDQELIDACSGGKVTRVSELLSLGADINYHDPRVDEVSCV